MVKLPMARCKRCSKGGIFFRVNADGFCKECVERLEQSAREEDRLKREEANAQRLKAQEERREILYSEVEIRLKDNAPDGKRFDAFDESTWDSATDSLFVLNGKSFKSGGGQKFSEKQLAKAIDDVIRGLSSHDDAKKAISVIGRKNVIRYMLENMAKGSSFSNAIDKMIRWINTHGEYSYRPKVFEILEFDTWSYASPLKEMIWNGNKILDVDNKPHTESEIVDLVSGLFKFLERDDKVIASYEKITAVKNLLNRMENPEYYAQQDKKLEEELDSSIPDGLFNPRDSETYKYAKDKPLVIDGVQIFSMRVNSRGKEVKENETEKGFIMLAQMRSKSEKWDAAVNQARSEFREKGIENPNDQTAGYVDLINKLYREKLGG